MRTYSRRAGNRVVRFRAVVPTVPRGHISSRRRPRRRGFAFAVILLLGIALAITGYKTLYRHDAAAPQPANLSAETPRTAGAAEQKDAPLYLPPFTAETVDGKPFVLAEWEDKSPLVIVFWAAWCDECAKELGVLNSLLTSSGDKPPMLVAVHRDDTEPAPQGYPPLAGLHERTVFLKDPGGRLFNLLGQGKPQMPLTIFVDVHGAVSARSLVPQTEEQLRVNVARIVVTETQNQNNTKTQ